MDVELFHRLWRDFDAGIISSLIELSLDIHPRLGCGIGNKVNNHFMADEWSTPPILGNMREHTMLDFVPFTRSGWKMTYTDVQSNFIGKSLKFDFPQPAPTSIASPSVCRNEKIGSVQIYSGAHIQPPTSECLNGKLRCVMVYSHTHPSAVGCLVVNPIRETFAQLLVLEVIGAHFLRSTLGLILTSFLSKITYQFFLCINGDNRLSPFLKEFHPFVDVLKLSIPIRMRRSLLCLSRRLKTIAELIQELINLRMTDTVSFLNQLSGQSTSALICPTKRRHWVTACRGLNQPIQRQKQVRIFTRELLTPTANLPDTPWKLITPDLWELLQLATANPDSTLRQSCCLSNGSDASMSQSFSFRCSPQTTSSFIEFLVQQFVLVLNCFYYRLSYHKIIMKNKLMRVNKNIQKQ